MVEQLPTVGAINTVIQVIPLVIIAARFAGDGCDADDGRRYQKTTGLADCIDVIGQLRPQ